VRIIQFFHKESLDQFQKDQSDELVDLYTKNVRTICQSAGFTDVQVTFEPIPTYLVGHGDHIAHFVYHIDMHFRVESAQGSFGVLLLVNTMIALDLTYTRITSHQISADMDNLVDERAYPNIYFVSQGTMEAFYARMTSLPPDTN